jgi:LPXTG-motif cell wall-anchored protein
MKRVSSLFALPLAATAMLAASTVMSPAPDVAAQATAVPKPAAPAPAAKPAGAPATTAPRAGGIPLELAGALVAGGSALVGGGVYALRRRKRSA